MKRLAAEVLADMLKGYGGSFDWAKIQHIGAILRVRVITDPR